MVRKSCLNALTQGAKTDNGNSQSLQKVFAQVAAGVRKNGLSALANVADLKAKYDARRKEMAPILSELIGQPFATDIDLLDLMASEYPGWTPDVYDRTADATISDLLKSLVRRKRHQARTVFKKTVDSSERNSIPRDARRLLKLANKTKASLKKPGVPMVDVAWESNDFDEKRLSSMSTEAKELYHALWLYESQLEGCLHAEGRIKDGQGTESDWNIHEGFRSLLWRIEKLILLVAKQMAEPGLDAKPLLRWQAGIDYRGISKGNLQEAKIALLDFENRAASNGQADKKTDNSEKNFPKMPANPNVRKLANRIKRDYRKTAKTKMEIALEFTENNEKKAESLLRQVRRFPHLTV